MTKKKAPPRPIGDFFEGYFTRRQYMVRQAIMDGADMTSAIEAVATTAIEHPDWEMDEERTWEEWVKTTA